MAHTRRTLDLASKKMVSYFGLCVKHEVISRVLDSLVLVASSLILDVDIYVSKKSLTKLAYTGISGFDKEFPILL